MRWLEDQVRALPRGSALGFQVSTAFTGQLRSAPLRSSFPAMVWGSGASASLAPAACPNACPGAVLVPALNLAILLSPRSLPPWSCVPGVFHPRGCGHKSEAPCGGVWGGVGAGSAGSFGELQGRTPYHL